MSSGYLSWSSIVVGVLILFGLAAAFLAAVGSSRSQDALNTELVQSQEQDTPKGIFLRGMLKRNRLWALAAAAALGLVFIMTGVDRVNDYQEKTALRGQIRTLQAQLRDVPGHYTALTITADEQNKLLANLKALQLDFVKDAPAVYYECGTEETRVGSELAETFREVHLPAFFSPTCTTLWMARRIPCL